MKFAVLIDADNVSAKYVKAIMDEVSKYGTATVKRIYGDWTSTANSKWKDVLLQHSIIPIQHYNYSVGKNSSDSALIIDAMDLLYSNIVEGFCIVSSDSDFTRLVSRIRQQGIYVLGMGEKKTSDYFIKACDKFTYLEIISPDETEKNGKKVNGVKKDPGTSLTVTKLVREIKDIIAELSDDDGWVTLGELGSALNRRYPSFDTRNYGFKKLTPLLQALGPFETRSVPSADPNVKHVSVRVKPNKKK